ncbi:uncharacterized protein LOC129566121 [Sitodiplosis mosellana]|uniref:uncharacterized protein LOC129566121 n=1 Tax=Sitodiplosis mosellana TaxID=263140 RepID=UPI00244394FA|nr:uncharacterized protein LOC129566121 [Sitodiplosis mosellana]
MNRRDTNTDDESVLAGLERLKIDDSHVNKMSRRRSNRIQEREERRKTLEINFDWFNNNLPVKSSPVKKPTKSENEFELEFDNVHYQRAIMQFTYIKNNEHLARHKKKSSDDIGIGCDCILKPEQVARGEKGCGSDCLNRVMSIECDQDCPLGPMCSNQRFQKYENARCAVFITEMKGYGLFASTHIPKNKFIMEFVGEVVAMSEFKRRSKEYEKKKLRHCYVMTSSGNHLIDATQKGNLTRFVNHSCDPNAETQKWTVNGECRIGIFSKRPIQQFEEISINYQFERFGKDAQACYCESANCSGYIGSK